MEDTRTLFGLSHHVCGSNQSALGAQVLAAVRPVAVGVTDSPGYSWNSQVRVGRAVVGGVLIVEDGALSHPWAVLGDPGMLCTVQPIACHQT